MKMSRVRQSFRRKIQLDRGDTLGGTVPLGLRDHVQPNLGYGERRFGRRRRRGRSTLVSWIATVLVGLGVAAGAGLGIGAFSDGAEDVPAALQGTAGEEMAAGPAGEDGEKAGNAEKADDAGPVDPDTAIIQRLRELFAE